MTALPTLPDRIFAWIFRTFRDRMGGRAHAGPDVTPLYTPSLLAPTIDYEAESMRYSNRYRAAFLINFSLGFVAVALALTPLSGLVPEHELHAYGWALTLSEVLCISIILLIHWYGRDSERDASLPSRLLKRIGLRKINQGWRGRWASMRLAAEQVRYADLMLGFPGSKLPVNNLLGDTGQENLEIARHLAELSTKCPDAPENAAYNARYRRYFTQLIASQRHYHKVNAHRYHRIHHRLHRIADACFYLTVIACVSHFWWHHPVLSVLAAGLPALAAACHGILASGEFAKLSEQSEEMSESLKALEQQIDPHAQDAGDRLRQQVTTFYDLVIREALGWHVTLRDKDVQVA
ncbi:hypothetical protein [Ralstonia flaminis]|jgi:hypothetical protein|uniref:DUF4231 domain-containing protein n=1 Tax=Ralstonia flaminis TaxID=3058597 RepID=A0ABN9JL95_9RALS|nr:hypothetical protein [Ralstonia sp. LMG 18101]CAJ0816191.1 hypothetical protein LMG18101_02842 [Ralstonia sp. LMG 18101]